LKLEILSSLNDGTMYNNDQLLKIDQFNLKRRYMYNYTSVNSVVLIKEWTNH